MNRIIRALPTPAARRAVLISATASFLAAAPAAAGDVVTPSFWDPHHVVHKPDMSDLRSIRFLTEDDYPPFHFTTPDGALTGFDVDLARAICEELKLACTVQARRWDTLSDALDQRQGDAIIAAIRIDEKTRANLDFTAPYSKTPARFVTKKAAEPTEATPEGLRGKTIGVEAGSAHEAYLKAFFPNAILKPYANQKLLREAMNANEIDALFGDGASLAAWLQELGPGGCCAFQGGPFMESHYFGEGVGIAVAKDNRTLRQALDYALAALAAKGVYTELYLKYFPISPY